MYTRQPHHNRCILLTLAAILVVSTLGSGRAAAQTITQIIDCTGDGTGNCATLAGNDLSGTEGIAVDAAGNVYLTGFSSANAFKITPDGIITEIIDATGTTCGDCNQVVGGGPGCSDPDCEAIVCASDPFCCSSVWNSLCADLAANLCGCDPGNTLNRPFSIAVDTAGNVYVPSDGTNSAFKITPAGVITEIIDATGAGAGMPLREPQGIAVDAAGNVFVAGRDSSNVFKITPAGVITEIIDFFGDGVNFLSQPRAIAVDAAGNVYVTGESNSNTFKITPAGVITKIIGATGDGTGNTLNSPRGIAVDLAGNAYVTGFFLPYTAFKITPAGVITQIIDATGDGAGNTLGLPHGIAADAAGNAYVTGEGSNNAFKITPSGVITEIIDATGDGTGNLLQGPQDIAVDATGSNVYVAGFVFDNAFKINFDADGDGVLDAIDVCPNTAPGVPVDSEGRPRGDMEGGDCDIDLADFAVFEESFTGP